MLDALHNRFLLAAALVAGGLLVVAAVVGIWAAVLRARPLPMTNFREGTQAARPPTSPNPSQ